MARVVRLPEDYWNMIDADAARCKRSGEKHLEALLSRLFGLGNTEIEITDQGVLANLDSLRKAAVARGKAKAAKRRKPKN
jgi:hypothetical protein